MSYIEWHPDCDCEHKTQPNRKGKYHKVCCMHDDPDFTMCTCTPIMGTLVPFTGEVESY